MRKVSYKYNIGDVVALKPDHYFEADVMGQKVLVTAAEIVGRKDYNGPCYNLGGSGCFWDEFCIAGLATGLKNRLYSYEGAEVYVDIPAESSCDVESSGEPESKWYHISFSAKLSADDLSAMKKRFFDVINESMEIYDLDGLVIEEARDEN